jgi:L-2,4-diaminobutyrate decarboxylase
VPVDDALRMRADALADAVRAIDASGARVMCVVANAGATTAGSYDPIAEIADVCASVPKDGPAWLHVDGAHGASLALSRVPARRALLAGVERADSVVWDAHKMLGMPALVTAVLFRDGRDGAAAFAQDAGYLFEDVGDDAMGDAWADIGKRTVECTKRMMSLKLYACLQAFGVGAFRDHVDRLCDLGAQLAAILRARTTATGAPAFELLTEPAANIVVFRRAGDDGGKTAAIRKRILADGKFYIVQVRGARGLWLRTAIMNPLTNDTDLSALVDEVLSGP